MGAKILQDDQGNASSMRFVWVAAVLTILGVWAYISISTRVFQNFTLGDAGWFATLFAGKVGQKYVEAQASRGQGPKPPTG